jgi:hypothetical protein
MMNLLCFLLDSSWFLNEGREKVFCFVFAKRVLVEVPRFIEAMKLKQNLFFLI